MAEKKCAVCDWKIEDKGQTVEHGGKVVIVCCDDCAAKVRKDPDKYIKGK